VVVMTTAVCGVVFVDTVLGYSNDDHWRHWYSCAYLPLMPMNEDIEVGWRGKWEEISEQCEPALADCLRRTSR
jgi:hypothetical protein